MTTKTKAAGRGDASAAYKITSGRNYSSIHSLVKAVIVSLANRGLFPYRTADWLIQRGGMRDA